MDGLLITAGVVDTGQCDVVADHLSAEGIDPATFGPGTGTVDVGDLTTTLDAFDLDGDGIVDSRVVSTDSDAAAIVVVSDFDRDGAADRVTIVESDGDFAGWECHRDEQGVLVWDRIDSGTL